MKVLCGARSSMLSRKQFEEVQCALQALHPHIVLEPIWAQSPGDRDHAVSLRTVNKTDFFTKDLDDLLLAGQIRVAVHSAKDLPHPLPEGLIVAAITCGIDPRDSLVMREKESWQSLPKGAKIGVSSDRRERLVLSLRSDFSFVDLRGTIEMRLAKLTNKEIDGLVMAEAALIRLGWTHWNRCIFEEKTAPLQGKLAVVCRIEDEEMQQLFHHV